MKKIFLFEKVKFPKLINRIGKGQKVENELPAKRKRSDSKASSDVQDPDATVVPPVRHKLRRTKKNENLRDEWKKYHNNFIPVIPSESTINDPNATINASSSIENTNSNSFANSILKSRNSISQSYENIKYSIKNSISNNNKNKDKDDDSEMKDQHVAKKRRLLSFIPI